MLHLVIKGAYYHESNNDEILMPHFTGEFQMVDCTKYILLEELKDTYADDFIRKNKEDTIEYDDKTYYYAESSPKSTGDWDLLSDLSELAHQEDNFDF